MTKVKTIEIDVVVYYRDEENEAHVVKKSAKDFESAEENLGKLERFILKLQKND